MPPSVNKIDPAEHFRAEIEDRTALGETCEQIAAALRAKGVAITNKTVARRRLEWGLRKRAVNKSTGTTRPHHVQRALSETKKGLKTVRKEEIQARSRAGESAEQIAAALEADGFQMKKGASTILRLQTLWGLIPPDHNRARGRKPRDRTAPRPPTVRSSKRTSRTQRGAYRFLASKFPSKTSRGGMPSGTTESTARAAAAELESLPVDEASQPSVSLAAEIMSVELLVDLANSTAAAASNLKSLLQTHQACTLALNDGTPRPLEEIAATRRKIRDAAAVMHDLTSDAVGD